MLDAGVAVSASVAPMNATNSRPAAVRNSRYSCVASNNQVALVLHPAARSAHSS